MLPVTTLFFLVPPSGSFVDIGEVHSLGSIVSTVGVVVDPSAGIGLVVVTSLVASSGGAILPWVPVKRRWCANRCDVRGLCP